MQRRHWAQPLMRIPRHPLLILFDLFTSSFVIYVRCRYEGYADFRLAIEKYAFPLAASAHICTGTASMPGPTSVSPLLSSVTST